VAAAIWISTGLWRWLGGMEKPADYYTGNHVFWLKLGLLVVILALEVVPITTLIRWRRQSGGASPLDTSAAPRLAGISTIQAMLIVFMVLAATAMARGYGSPEAP
jgi:putative membrane protein